MKILEDKSCAMAVAFHYMNLRLELIMLRLKMLEMCVVNILSIVVQLLLLWDPSKLFRHTKIFVVECVFEFFVYFNLD